MILDAALDLFDDALAGGAAEVARLLTNPAAGTLGREET